jgi:hypothetical protein
VLCNDAVPTAKECDGKDNYAQKSGKYGVEQLTKSKRLHTTITRSSSANYNMGIFIFYPACSFWHEKL